MKRLFVFFMGVASLLLLCLTLSCRNDGPFEVDFMNARATIVAKEICKENALEDYWIIDVLMEGDDPLIGDEVVIDGETYSNAFKTRDLSDEIKKEGVGTQIALEYYPPVAVEKVMNADCEVSEPLVYLLRDLKANRSMFTYF